MRRRELLRRLRRIDQAQIAAWMNWIHTNAGTSRNCANRARFVGEQAAELSALLPDIIEALAPIAAPPAPRRGRR